MKFQYLAVTLFFSFPLGLLLFAGCGQNLQLPTTVTTLNYPSPTPTVTSTPTPLVQDVTQANFQQVVLNSQIPVMVDVWASWCGWCTAYAPTVNQFAQNEAGKLKVVRVDYDANSTLDSTYNITALPTTLFFKNGQLVNSIQGDVPESALITALNAITP